MPVPPEMAPSGRDGYYQCSVPGYVMPDGPPPQPGEYIIIVRLPFIPPNSDSPYRMYSRRGKWEQVAPGGDLAYSKSRFVEHYEIADDDPCDDWLMMCRVFEDERD